MKSRVIIETNTTAEAFLQRRQPVVSVDTKKKESERWSPSRLLSMIWGQRGGFHLSYGGGPIYPDARDLFITADAGGSNGYRALEAPKVRRNASCVISHG